jgi:putative CocE/NonD family hydrolase
MSNSLDTTSSAHRPPLMRWGIRIPLRDGIQLSATLYLPADQVTAGPVIVLLTPYVAQTYHDEGVYFSSHGYAFLAVDVRGRGNSEGVFKPNIHEAKDGYDVVEWVAQQPYCNGKVTMWGASYGGHAQWMTAKEFPPHLMTIVPVASPYLGVDFPIRHNIASPYWMQWLTLVSGRTSQEVIFRNYSFWSTKFREWFESGSPFKQLDTFLGSPSAVFQEWVSHPHRDAYWDTYNPTAEQYSRLSIPVLTITGIYDGDQPGALAHYREHLRHTSAEGRAAHYLVIGPWDHSGTRAPKAEFLGLRCGPASLVDLRRLHLDWYRWTMQGGPKPAFLQKNVAYYVMGAELWRYSDTLEEITAHRRSLYLRSNGNSAEVFNSGELSTDPPGEEEPAQYVYDPRNTAHAELECSLEPETQVDQRLLFALDGQQLVYHSAPFERDTEISGFFEFCAWIAIDQPDTDFRVSIYEIGFDGGSVQLSFDSMRARYRDSLHEPRLVHTTEPLRYEFSRFTFVSRQIKRGSRLRLVLGPINSIYSEKNFNSGGTVSEESMKDARPVKVSLFHDRAHPTVLYVPIGTHAPLGAQ